MLTSAVSELRTGNYALYLNPTHKNPYIKHPCFRAIDIQDLLILPSSATLDLAAYFTAADLWIISTYPKES